MAFGKKLFFVICSSCILLLRAGFALALELHYPTIFGRSLNDTSSFREFICYIFGLGTAVAIFICVIVIAFGGISYLVSYGRGKFTDEGKEWIKAGITGFLVVVCASLIVYTINPDLTTCRPIFFPNLGLTSYNGYNIPPGVKLVTYNEIPIGTLTETLLTRTTYCYDFNQTGDPIDGDKITTDDGKQIIGPTYANYDRIDCLAQLFDGIQKKSQVITGLSNSIKGLMNKCECTASVCESKNQNCNPVGTPCSLRGECSICNPVASCQAIPEGNGDCCPADSGVKDPNNPKRNLTGREQIEHGPVNVSINPSADNNKNCQTENYTFRGLDEFRSDYNNDYYAIKNEVEKTVLINNKPVEIIDTGNCGTCENNCTECTPNPNNPNDPNYKKCLQKYNKCISDYNTCQDKMDKCKQASPWYKLKLIDQLAYFKGKLEERKQNIQDDKDTLNNAKTDLGKCYLAVPYIDIVKTYQTTNQQDTIILTNKTYNDPQTNNKVDASKYCNGFNYSNSTCLQKCNNMCPDSSTEALNLYKDCTDPKTQKTCIEDAYNKRPCLYSDNSSNAPKTFGDCIDSCQSDCVDNCSKEYLPCSDQYKICKSQCENNSQCVLDNAGQCLFGADQFANCASNVTDQGNANYCIDNAYLCKAGSNEYAGYQDCVNSPPATLEATLKAPASPVSSTPPDITDVMCTTTNNATEIYSGSSVSSSFLCANPQFQKCPDPYSPAGVNSFCFTATYPDATCQDVCPETTKCPAASDCPQCACNGINTSLRYSLPTKIKVGGSCLADLKIPNQKPRNYDSSVPISGYRITGPQCVEYSHNDDPLTFYCENDWWLPDTMSKEGLTPTAIGQERYCSPQGEVPVGQMVDNAENWVQIIFDKIQKEEKHIQDMVDLLKKSGEAINPNNGYAPNYCQCDAQFENNNSPVSTTDCVTSINGTFTTACQNNGCQQMIDYMSLISNDYGVLKNDYIDFYTSGIKDSYGRSDIMKQLTYSRQATNQCSASNSTYGADARLLDCTRVEDELIPPVNSQTMTYNKQAFPGYCYGTKLGKATGASLTDNWFCCAQYSNNPATTGNPIYNIQK